MPKYIDAEKLKAELDKHYQKYQSKYRETRDPYTQGLVDSLDFAEQIVTSLQQEQPPRGYDEAYLNECIAKAGKTWKGVDVDKFIDEVRGRETVELGEEVKKYFQGLWPGTEMAELWNTDMHFHFTPPAILRMVEYFYELGLKARE